MDRICIPCEGSGTCHRCGGSRVDPDLEPEEEDDDDGEECPPPVSIRQLFLPLALAETS